MTKLKNDTVLALATMLFSIDCYTREGWVYKAVGTVGVVLCLWDIYWKGRVT